MDSILLLEDEESVNRGIVFSLAKEGYTILSASNIKNAYKLFKEHNPSLIICDINLPDGNGLDFIKEIRKSSDVHIICLTALDQEIDHVIGYEAGADDYIVKPFSLSVLTLKISAFFKKQDKESGQIIVSENIKIYLQEMRLYSNEVEISLTKNEWRLLNLFIEHPKQILSKNQILQQIFDIDGDFVDENTIAVNIRRLREKIEDDSSNPIYIKNIRGIGYIWDKECKRI